MKIIHMPLFIFVPVGIIKHQRSSTREKNYFKIHFVHCMNNGYSNLVWEQGKS